MAKKATCKRYRPGVEAVSLSVRVQSVLRLRPAHGGGLTQVETEPKPQAAGAQPAAHPAAAVTVAAAQRRTTLEGVAEDAFRQHRTEIYRYLRRRTTSIDQAEELTQQVFADAALTLSRMTARPGSVLALLYTIARRRVADEARRYNQHGQHVPLDELDDEPAAPDPANDVAHALHDAIALLPSEQPRVVCLKLIEGCSFAEIASLIGISEAAAKMRFQRGLAALRQELERQGIHPAVA
jgi:RNA polymerase sigma-70 factor (ECF subfamily)